jgi:hypothetical protein
MKTKITAYEIEPEDSRLNVILYVPPLPHSAYTFQPAATLTFCKHNDRWQVIRIAPRYGGYYAKDFILVAECLAVIEQTYNVCQHDLPALLSTLETMRTPRIVTHRLTNDQFLLNDPHLKLPTWRAILHTVTCWPQHYVYATSEYEAQRLLVAHLGDKHYSQDYLADYAEWIKENMPVQKHEPQQVVDISEIV